VTTLEVLQPGEIFGAMSALVEAEPYPATAEAVTDATAWVLARRELLRLLTEEPRLGNEILTVVSRRLHAAHERLRAFAHDPAPARLARELLRVARAGEARVTRRALAEAAGTTVETAIRVLRRFHQKGLIRGEVGRVHVLDERELSRVAGESEP
jgi:CRP/FNR family transcriptional regulator